VQCIPASLILLVEYHEMHKVHADFSHPLLDVHQLFSLVILLGVIGNVGEVSSDATWHCVH
jgi:hypothetical protein